MPRPHRPGLRPRVWASTLLTISTVAVACAPLAEDSTIEDVGTEAAVVRVDDGDSLLVEFNGNAEKARLLGINAPERDECMGPEARDRLRALVQPAIIVEPGPEPRDQFGRLLVSVWSDGLLVNEQLVTEGLALALSTDGPHAQRLMEAEERARSQGSGLWSADACGGGPIPDVRIELVNADPPGPDEQALDEETVTIANHDDRVVDLGGWVLRDESTANRFVFTPGTDLDPGERLIVATGCRTTPGRVAWCADSPVWNNRGDSALLLDSDGRVVDHWHYGG